MSETVIVALLALVGSLAGTYFSNRKSSALLEYRLQQLEKKVDLHNTVIERTFNLEKETRVLDEKIKVANNRISDLEKIK